MNPGYTISVLDHGHVRYIDHMGSDQRVVEAARVSYASKSKGDEQDRKLLEYLWKNKHTSPFEMCKVTLNVKLPVFVMRQWVRHRMQNLNEVSARYTELPEEFYMPAKWRKQDTKNKQGSIESELFFDPCADVNDRDEYTHAQLSKELGRQCKQAYTCYKQFLRLGVAKEMARFVLPVNIYTECYSTWDLKNLLHFISLREDSHAQAEIQEYGRAVKAIVQELFPWTLAAFDKYKFTLQE